MSITVDDMIKKLQKAKEDIPNMVEKIVLSNSQKVIELNRSVQLYQKGVDSYGNKLKPYRPNTIILKKERNQISKHTTLKDTGMFYNGFKVIMNANYLYITSSDEKTDMLMEKYGKNILGLTKDNEITLYDEIITPELCEFLNKTI